MSSELLVERDGPVLRVTFNRPDQRNAMTWGMYDELLAACTTAQDDPHVRAMVLRGAGGRAFVAGTDISQFLDFGTAADGLAYERHMEAVARALETVRVPTVAVVDGYCTGAGLVLAACADLRLATPDARFGVPIARNVGNCLSMNACSLLEHRLGASRTLDLLLRGRFLTGEEARDCGFVADLVPAENLDAAVADLLEVLAGHAPLTMWAAKEALYRLRTRSLPDDEDIVVTVYGSDDFRDGVRAFEAKQTPQWQGR